MVDMAVRGGAKVAVKTHKKLKGEKVVSGI